MSSPGAMPDPIQIKHFENKNIEKFTNFLYLGLVVMDMTKPFAKSHEIW